jgi:hypothetical protein
MKQRDPLPFRAGQFNMELCSHNHDEVCYECRKCPVCELQDQLEEKKTEVGTLENRVQELENEVNNLQGI